MEALLPSEIARLVFGYLEDQKCDEAARSFLEASPHLQECRTAVLGGRRFNTRVNGYTLVDIFDKFFAAHSLVQERLNKVGDCDQVRQCGDLLDQLRFLIGGSRGQRFVVNINVPSQANSQTYGGSPIITSSIRKRHHSGGSDRDRTKRTQKPLQQLFDKQPEPVSSQLGCETVEATPLESLPGHINLITPHQHERLVIQDSDNVCCTSTKNDFTECPQLGDLQSISKQICHHPSLPQPGMEQDNSSGRSERYSPVSAIGKEKTDERHIEEDENQGLTQKGKTMATSTDELTTYSSIEVQTTPYALSESESIGLDDEPIENLSLLTKELLNRTELQERIAENINKAILPIEMPSKDESLCESMGGELNTTIMVELNNAIKSIVEATETDPIFEHFLDEMIGPNNDTDTSPDEDHDVRVASEPATNSRILEEPSNTAVIDMDIEEETAVVSNKGLTLSGATEVPLKQRLRSSSRQQNNKPEDEGDKPKEVEKLDSSLEDHNAAAILSIINANIVSEKQVIDKSGGSGSNVVAKPAMIVESNELSQTISISSESQVADSTEVVIENDQAGCSSVDTTTSKKTTNIKLNTPQPKEDQNGLITEQEMMAMPTLIVCSQDEIRECIKVDTLYASGKAAPSSESRFIPIAPKKTDVLPTMMPAMYLRAVQVPVPNAHEIQPAISNTRVEPTKTKPQSPPKVSGTSKKHNRKMTKKSKNPKPVIIPDTIPAVETEDPPVVNKEPANNSVLESITLYANDNSFGTMIETGHMPAINLDDSMTLTGTGLSPYLKLHDSRNHSQQVELPTEKPNEEIPTKEILDPGDKSAAPIVLPHTENVLISRRTPKSLLKSRSKNNRLSLSTPRRRSSHIRALDFNTPTKSSSSEHKLSGSKNLQFSSKSSKRARSVCRTSLFKSPPFPSSFNSAQKGKSPAKDRQIYKVPIATRSPAPKLMGGWDKYTGVGMILGGTSPHPSTSTSFFGNQEPNSPPKPSSTTVKKSWDADLRQALQEYQEPTCSTFAAKKSSAKAKGRTAKNSVTGSQEKVSVSENSENRCQSKQDKNIQPHGSKTISDQIGDEKLDGTRDNLPDSNSDLTSKSETLTGPSNKIETSKCSSKIEEKLMSDKTKEKPVVKKYAKLKTLETKLSKYKKRQVLESVASYSVDSSQKNEFLKISPETQSQPHHISRMIDLETPRKIDNCTGIPATPRLLSPSSSTITPFTKLAEELSKVPSFISTPDFPPTPSIALTPKVMGENTIDAIKKGDYGTCSPYYQPSTEQPDILEKLIASSNTLKENAAEILPATSSVNIETGVMNGSGDLANDFVMTVSSSKLEITEFEVIKENLPKEDADKELKISTSSKNNEETLLSKSDNPVAGENRKLNEAENVHKRSLTHGDGSSSSGNESSDSSSSDTSSSSSCSSSCSCSSIATTSTPFKSTTKCKTKSNTCREASNDCSSKNLLLTTIDHNLLNDISPITTHEVHASSEKKKSIVTMKPIPSSFARGEASPTKLMPLIKTLEEVDASAKETPAKDEALLSEANISETPSSSKSGIESLTNLNSKISALDSPGDQGPSRNSQLSNKIHVVPSTRVKPKIVAVQHFLPDVSVALKPPSLSEIVSSTTQPLNSLSTLSSDLLDGKLGSHLEEKRLRLMAKLKGKPQTTIVPQRGSRAKQVNLYTKINYKDKRERRIAPSHVVSRNTGVKKVNQTPEIEEAVVKDTKIQSKQNPGDEKARVLPSKTIPVKSSSKERKYNESSTTHSNVKKTANINRQQGCTLQKKDVGELLKSKKITEADDQRVIQKRESDRSSSTESSDKKIRSQKSEDLITPKLDSKECETMQPANTTEIIKDLKVTEATKPEPSLSQKCDATEKVETVKDKSSKLLQSCSEDAEYRVENVAAVPVKKNQAVPMSKVDQIKRDLFSDEENSDQRTTRSRTRQLSDAQKNEAVLPVSESVFQTESKICQPVTKKPKEELANVLECLKLVPANKNEIVEKASSSPKSSMNRSAVYEFVYDDSVSTVKKKRTKFRSSSLEYVINVELREENYRECSRLMTPTNYEEIFNISPKPKKRVVAKKLAVKSSKSTKAEASKAPCSVGIILKNELIKPLASSSSQTVKLKTQTPKIKAYTKIQHKIPKPSDKGEKKKPKDETQASNKRKITDAEEDQSGEKKRRIADPQSLLKKLDLDLFLNSVHGPV